MEFILKKAKPRGTLLISFDYSQYYKGSGEACCSYIGGTETEKRRANCVGKEDLRGSTLVDQRSSPVERPEAAPCEEGRRLLASMLANSDTKVSKACKCGEDA